MRTQNDGRGTDYEKKVKRLRRKIRRLSWFPSYQTFTEIGIRGKRDDLSRYRYVDFSVCRGKVIVDFGCNLGQTCVKAHAAGAKRIIGVDGQKDTIGMAREIAALLEADIEYYAVDFNGADYRKRIIEILGNDKIDSAFFLSVYRTKELKDRDGLLGFIIDMTGERLFFEGHADPGIDTDAYYTEVFRRFPVEFSFQGYTQEQSRPFYIVTPKR